MQQQMLVYLMLLLDHSFREVGVRLAFRSHLDIIAGKHGAIAGKHGTIAGKHGAIAGCSCQRKHGAIARQHGAIARKHGAIAGCSRQAGVRFLLPGYVPDRNPTP